jgi:hypothetical protein
MEFMDGPIKVQFIVYHSWAEKTSWDWAISGQFPEKALPPEIFSQRRKDAADETF